MITRRLFLGAAAGLLRGAANRLRFGVPDWSLQLQTDPKAIALAKKIGFEGIEVSLGGRAINRRLPLADPELQSTYLNLSRTHNIPIVGACVMLLASNYLKNDPLGRKWLADSIPIASKLNARVLLLPFYGNGALNTQAERDYVADILREMAPEAERTGLVFGLEASNSAREQAGIIDRSRSHAVKVYYDVGNSTTNGYDILSELRWLGRDRICQVHLKDGEHYLGEGKIDFPAIMRILVDMDYTGFAHLETAAPSKSIEKDTRRNLAYARRLLAETRRTG